ncbi:hypothetical protein SAMN05216262_1302 [Colwellia chukchiensis]|uniref:Uncharacterized protein n=1 Tax=Colwellia chukchiensis TaxID=641665 RepID=A0A1H7TX96_9GAMM|nr:DUF5329 family protein [Colwellia chukchiensis]SEL89119.1 hypothetical protein SAMN05216262_1302 [Colwellia chukchiensis]
MSLSQVSQVILVVAVLLSFHVFASTEQEIAHLLSYVERTQCLYERNGTKHNGVAAVKHIRKKYQYFADKITSSEDFIKYSATKSTISGKHYLIHCPKKATRKSRDWLLMELNRFRASKQ